MTATCPAFIAAMSVSLSMLSMRALACVSTVRIGICQPSQLRASTPMALSVMASKPAGHLLARCDDHVIFGRIVERARFLAEADEAIGFARHGRNHDSDFIATRDLGLDAVRDIADPLHAGHRRAAKFHHNTRHGLAACLSSTIKGS